MAVVQSYTKAKSDEIYDETVVDGSVVGDNLILEKRSGATINAGNVRGPAGTNGTNGATGPTGPVGPAKLAYDAELTELNSPGSTIENDTHIGPLRANVPVIAGHLYEVRVELELAWANFTGGGTPSRWDFWVTRNTVLLKKFSRYESNIGGADTRKHSGSIFFTAASTIDTDDYGIFADEVVAGAVFARTDTCAYMTIIDWGDQTP